MAHHALLRALWAQRIHSFVWVGAHSVKDYFLNYHETHSNDFVLSNAGRTVELLSSDISDWRITFADTGFETPIGERLRRVRDYLGDDGVFLANYGDVLTNAPMNDLIDDFVQTDAVGSLLAVPPQDSFHVVRIDDDSRLTGIEPVADMNMRINGGYFILRQEIFDYLNPGDDLVTDAFARAAHAGKFRAVRFDGFSGHDGHPQGVRRLRRCIGVVTARGHCGSRRRVASSQHARPCGPCRYRQIR